LDEKLVLKNGRKQLSNSISTVIFLPILLVTFSSIIVSLVVLSLLFIAAGVMSPPASGISNLDVISSSVVMATSFWIAGSGGQIMLGNLSVDVVLLGISLFSFAVCYFMIKLRSSMPISLLHFGAFCYTVIVLLISCFLEPQDILHILRIVVISYLISFTAYFVGNSQHSIGYYFQKASFLRKLYAPLCSAVILVLFILIIASFACLYGLSVNLSTTETIFKSLNAGPWEAFLISFLELAILPNFMLWMVGALFSTGFVFAGSTYIFTDSPTSSVLPLPILSNVPTMDTRFSTTIHSLLPYILIVIGLLVAIWLFSKTSKEHDFFYKRSRFFKQNPRKLAGFEILSNFICILTTIAVFFLCLLVLNIASSGYIHNIIDPKIGVQTLSASFSVASKIACAMFFVFVINSAQKVIKYKENDDNIAHDEVAKSGIMKVEEVVDSENRGNRRVEVSVNRWQKEKAD
jgi:hypothetical protein